MDYETTQLLSKLEDCAASVATDCDLIDEWQDIREEALANSRLKNKLPEWVVRNRSGVQLLDYLKREVATGAGSWSARRGFVMDSLARIYEVESSVEEPLVETISQLVTSCDSNAVTEAWTRISERIEKDPEGCITASRALLESVCKHILEEQGMTYTEREDLPRLYKMVAKELNLAPEQHQEEVFKQILSGCTGVVSGFASLRNKLGDAHGKGRHPVRPSKRHAHLAVGLAGSIALFLIETHQQAPKGD